MRETAERPGVRDATVEAACPACAGPVTARTAGAGAWVYCHGCRRLSRSILMPGPAGQTVMIHPLAAA